MKRNRLVILVGILLAALAFVGIVMVLNQNQAAEQAGPPMETVLVAAEDIAIGQPVTPDLVETREVEASAVIGEPLRDPSQVQGQPAIFNIPEGTQVTQAAVGLGVGMENLSAQLQTGEKAIAFVLDRAQGLNFLVQAGDTVDIVATFQLPPTLVPEGDTIRTVKTVLQNKRVLYVSGTNLDTQAAASPAPGEEGAAPAPQAPLQSIVIVIAGTDQDAELIRYAQRNQDDLGGTASTNLSVVLRSGDDEAVESTTGISIVELVNSYGVVVPILEDIEGLAPEATPEP